MSSCDIKLIALVIAVLLLAIALTPANMEIRKPDICPDCKIDKAEESGEHNCPMNKGEK